MNVQRCAISNRLKVGAVLLATLALSGCGKKSGEVTGIVRYRGNVLTSGTVSFHCDNGEILSSLISEEGAYRLSRVVPGPVHVTVISHASVPPGFARNLAPKAFASSPRGSAVRVPLVPRVPDRYSHADSTDLLLEVVTGEQVLDLDLTP